MITKETKMRVRQLEKISQPSEDEKLRQEFIDEYQSTNEDMAKVIEETDDSVKADLYQSVLSTRERILSDALSNPKEMARMLKNHRYIKTEEAREKSQKIQERIKERLKNGSR